jgi:hypothetical protein
VTSEQFHPVKGGSRCFICCHSRPAGRRDVGGALTFLLAAAFSAPSSAAEESSPSYCVMVYGEAVSATEYSPLLYEYCSTKGRDDAYKNLNSPTTQARLGRITAFASGDLLMTWFEDADYNDDNDSADKTDIYGDQGPCDTAGYRIEPNDDWKGKISSIGGTVECNRATLTNRDLNYGETQILPTPWVGERLDNNIGLVNVFTASGRLCAGSAVNPGRIQHKEPRQSPQVCPVRRDPSGGRPERRRQRRLRHLHQFGYGLGCLCQVAPWRGDVPA